tara:strand:- start:119 stop:292 length:174 start_codon:yes stop_codon:yes gene_type:complete
LLGDFGAVMPEGLGLTLYLIERNEMPKGKGSYGKKRGRPAKKTGGKSKGRKKTSYGY